MYAFHLKTKSFLIRQMKAYTRNGVSVIIYKVFCLKLHVNKLYLTFRYSNVMCKFIKESEINHMNYYSLKLLVT